MEEKFYSVSEAVRLIGVESHVLRYWEEELHIEIQRTSQGHRIYSVENIETFRKVKELKEKGIQLKAIRVLLEETEQKSEDPFLQQIGSLCQKDGTHIEEESECTERSECEVVLPQTKPDNLRQFEAILKQMIAEVVEEQNEKLEQAIAQMLKTEIEELYLQYYHDPAAEAAVSCEQKPKGIQKFWKWLKKEN